MIDVGQTVGNYDITAKLGEGGMGTVFLAEHPVIGSKVALKAIHPRFAKSSEVISRFMNEAKSVNQIRHDHIVDITDFGHTPEGDFYFIMEYLEGASLASVMQRGGRFEPTRALNIAVQIADALGASHEHGVIHRDLKPENIILIVRDGVEDFVKVLDFGLAKLTHPDRPLGHDTGLGSVMGTPYYMSPEQCEGKADLDHRADVYALGVMLFEMLTGKVPFGGRAYAEILVKQITLAPPAASSIHADISPALDSILLRALAKDPGARFQTMTEFRAALLDPESYASSGPVQGLPADLSLRMRVAMPMARSEMQLRPTALSEPEPIIELGPAPSSELGPAPSTFRSSAGAVEADDELKPRRHRGRVALLVGVAAVACVAFAGTKRRQQAGHFLVASVSAKNPTTVLVTFNSDPDGATVTRADGTVLGVTPLQASLTYGDAATSYLVRKEGYAAKTLSVVPNVPAPFFTVLEARKVAAVAAPLEPSIDALASDATPAPLVEHHRRRTQTTTTIPERSSDPASDEDGIMDQTHH